MTSDERISFSCTELTQPIGHFYVGAIAAADLVAISWTDVQRIERREVEEFLGIERPLSRDRVAQLEKYVRTLDATFPSSIIIAVSSKDAEYNESSGIMHISRAPKVAKIIDGQHRIAGLKEFSDGAFQVNVTVFVDMDLEDQAMVFATINLKQTPVSKSLAYNLYEYATSRSPQKTCHDIAKLLNKKGGSPFKDRIKILGRATPGVVGETLTQAAFVDQLLPLISGDWDHDRDQLKRGKTPERASDEQVRKLIFRNWFVDGQDEQIAAVLWNYFSAIKRKWPDAWTSTDKGLVLNRTTGFTALMRLLPKMYARLASSPGEIVSQEDFYSVFEKAPISDQRFTPQRYLPGSTGQRQLFEDLLEATQLK